MEQEIIDRCIKANPDIAKLDFGCEILLNDGRRVQVLHSDDKIVCVMNDEQMLYCVYRTRITQVFGRPIRLADIMFMFSKQINLNAYRFNFTKMLGKVEITQYDADGVEELSCFWVLVRDDLMMQGVDTKKFIYQMFR